MGKKDKVAVIYGGKSGEHEISLRSAASVVHNLDASLYDIIPIAIDKNGLLFLNDYQEMMTYRDSLPVKTEHSKALPSLDNFGKLTIDADVIFPVMHGPLYEDGCLQGLLESLSIAYVGCGVLSSAIGMDKDMTRKVACRHDIRHAPYVCLTATQSDAQRQTILQQLIDRNQWPLFVKPCSLGSSVGTHKVNDSQSLHEAVKDAFRFDHTVLVEDCIHGQEIEISVLEDLEIGNPPRASTPGEIKTVHQDGFYSYNAKYCQSELTDLIIPANISKDLQQKVQHAAIQIFQRLKCQGLARIDFFIAGNDIYFNEINTMPGFTSISMYPKLWQHDNLGYEDLLNQLVTLAKRNHQIKSNRLTDYQ
ncbi:D-alanine--D-alanine ligase family protein [Legionella sp. W05-934-2]|jgi:D-alanine-D-alanine ligase|uniref:D-alanine--D-alanine ligase family protein n=1 Tax=Legionella sp. W05-934-2 TaxID=1198649 RepID=UPI0034629413